MMVLLRHVLVFLLAASFCSVAWGQQTDTTSTDTSSVSTQSAKIADRVSGAFANSDPQQLITPSADQIAVSLFGTRTFYSQSQAYYVLRNAFEEHPPHNFSVTDVTQAAGSYFVSGRFQHVNSDRAYQVYARFVRGETNAWRLREIRIDNEVD